AVAARSRRPTRSHGRALPSPMAPTATDRPVDARMLPAPLAADANASPTARHAGDVAPHADPIADLPVWPALTAACRDRAAPAGAERQTRGRSPEVHPESAAAAAMAPAPTGINT